MALVCRNVNLRPSKHFDTAVKFLWHQWVFLCQLSANVWYLHETDFESHFWWCCLKHLNSLHMWVTFCVQLDLQAGYLLMTALLSVPVCNQVAMLLSFMCSVADVYYSSATPLRTTTTRVGLSQSRELLFPYLFMCTLLILAAIIIFLALCIFWIMSRKKSLATASRSREPIVRSSSANVSKHQGRHVFVDQHISRAWVIYDLINDDLQYTFVIQFL